MDLIQATGRWLYYFGLSTRGFESFEPANAMTRQTQQELQEELHGMNDWNLGMMNRALLRVMGMLFIEAARTFIQVQELRLRDSAVDTVEIDIEEDEESLYVQVGMAIKRRTWGELLEHLVRLAEDGNPGRREVMEGLKRRISQSLYLQGERGAQLHATLVAITTDLKNDQTHACDTEENDAQLIEKLRGEFKDHLTLETTPSEARSSKERPEGTGPADPGHLDLEVQEWERERQEEVALVAASQAEAEAERAKEEMEQNERDVQLYMEHEALAFRDWENWLVLNTPNAPKRRRPTFTLQPAAGGQSLATDGPSSSTSLWLPVGSPNFALHIQMEQVQGEPSAQGAFSQDGLSINSVTYDRAYSAWKAGTISDSVVEQLFGTEWLFLFQLSHRGTEADTMAPIMLDEEEAHGLGEDAAVLASGGDAVGALMSVAATQSDGLDAQLGGHGQWSQPLLGQDGLVLEVGDSSLEGAEEGMEEHPAGRPGL